MSNVFTFPRRVSSGGNLACPCGGEWFELRSNHPGVPHGAVVFAGGRVVGWHGDAHCTDCGQQVEPYPPVPAASHGGTAEVMPPDDLAEIRERAAASAADPDNWPMPLAEADRADLLAEVDRLRTELPRFLPEEGQ